jgi:hypothetical protein
MEIPAASIAQVQRLRDGRLVEIADDVCGTVKQLQEIDKSLRVRHSDVTGLFVLYQLLDSGEEHLVFTTPFLDQRVVDRFRKIAQPGYDYAAELDQIDRAADKPHDDRMRDKVEDAAERLAHAIRTDLKKARPGPVYVPPDLYE